MNCNSPIVSVVVATYNREKYVKKAIESVLSQTYKNIELIIIDDGSTDKTPEIIFEFLKKDQRIIILKNEINLGLTKSLNKAIGSAKGKYIARLDDDDYWCDENKMKKQVDFLEKNTDYVLTGGGIIRIDENGKEINRHLQPEKDEDIRKVILLDDAFVHSSVVFKKSVWELSGGYDGYGEDIFFSEDWDLWLKLGKIGKFYNFQEYFVCYMLWEGNISNRNIFYNLIMANKLRKRYRHDYPNFLKGFFLGWVSYLYVFLPSNRFLKPIFSKIKRIIFGPPV